MRGRYRSYGFSRFEFFPRSRPRVAKGGIKARSGRGAFGESWWAKRWIAVLEGFHMGGRLTRGRSYARRGQVLSIDIHKGKVEARVQGSRPTPYQVVIQMPTLSAGDWQKLAASLSGQALYAAKLLAGEMPEDIEQAFEAVKLSLFPEQLRDLKTGCSCPDYSNPCKHIAAVYYLLGEEFDRDPFLLFKLRGITREELIARLGDGTPAAEKKQPARRRKAAAADKPAEPAIQPQPLPADPDAFWTGEPLPDDLLGEVRAPHVPAAVLKRLGGFPFWRGERPLQEVVEPVYAAATARGLRVLLGDAAGFETSR